MESIDFQKVKNGDEQVFIQLLDIYEEKIYKMVYFILFDKELAGEVVQNAFVDIYSKLSRMSNLREFEICLFKKAIGICMACKENESSRKPLKAERAAEMVGNSGDKEAGQGDELFKGISAGHIMKSINFLPFGYRIVMVLFYLNNINIRDIATIVDCSEMAVKWRLMYSKKVCRKVLAA